MDPAFQMSQPSSMIFAREIIEMSSVKFFLKHTLAYSKYYVNRFEEKLGLSCAELTTA